MDYKTSDGEPTTLYRLVRDDPGWAASRIDYMNKEIESLREQIKKADVEYVNRGLHIDMLAKKDKEIESLRSQLADERKHSDSVYITGI